MTRCRVLESARVFLAAREWILAVGGRRFKHLLRQLAGGQVVDRIKIGINGSDRIGRCVLNNEWGYSARLVDMARLVADRGA